MFIFIPSVVNLYIPDSLLPAIPFYVVNILRLGAPMVGLPPFASGARVPDCSMT